MRHMTALSHQAGGAPANGEVGWARRSGEANGPMSKIDAHLSRVYVDCGGKRQLLTPPPTVDSTYSFENQHDVVIMCDVIT